MKRFLIPSLFFIIFPIFGCPQNPVAPHPTPEVKDTAECPNAQEHLESLCNQDKIKNSYCCKVVAPTKKGKNFTQLCIEEQNKGVFFNPKCLSSINSCDQIDVCTSSENPK